MSRPQRMTPILQRQQEEYLKQQLDSSIGRRLAHDDRR